MGRKILSKMEVLERFSRVHGDKYAYCDDDTLLQVSEMIEIYCRGYNHTFKKVNNILTELPI